MTEQNKSIPSQRGTSSGEIGQNPVETIGKDPAPPENPPANHSQANKEDKSKESSSSKS